MIFIQVLLQVILVLHRPNLNINSPKLILERSPKLMLQEDTIICFGTQPYWTVNITKKETFFTIYDGFENKKEIFPYVSPIFPGANTDIKIFTTRNKKSNLQIILVKQYQPCYCNDGMSDTEYAYQVIVIKNDAVFEGCASGH